MQSTNYVYQTIGKKILQFLPEASLQYSEAFWANFEPYFFRTEENVQAFAGELIQTGQEAVKCVFKMSQYEDNLVRHEYTILQALVNHFGSNFPHICKPYGLVKYKSYIDISRGVHDGEDTSAPHVIREMLLLEKIPSIGDFGDFATECSDPAHLLSLLKQVLMCIRLFRRIGFTHYDLHTGNILVRRCSPHLTLEYEIDGETYLVPTFGYIAVIIDFGFSYLRPANDDARPANMNCTLRCAHYGLLTDRYLWAADYIRVLFNLCGDIRQTTHNWKQALRRKTLKLFHACDFISKKSGWLKADKQDQIDALQRRVVKRKLQLFAHFDWLEITQILVPELAPCEQGLKEEDVLADFEREWSKIEERITDRKLLYYLYKYLVSHISLFREDPQRDLLVKQFFLEEFTRLVNAFVPIIDYSVLIACTLNLAAYLQGYLYKYISAREAAIHKQYQSLPFSETNCDNVIWHHFSGGKPIVVTKQRLLIKH